MLTIKHIVSGGEFLVQAKSVSFDHERSELTAHGLLDGAGNSLPDVTFKGGCAYVMNDAGQTVGAYNLRKWK